MFHWCVTQGLCCNHKNSQYFYLITAYESCLKEEVLFGKKLSENGVLNLQQTFELIKKYKP